MKSLTCLAIFILGIVSFLSSPAFASVEGQCANCHTMHNSQNNNNMIFNTLIDGVAGGTHGGGYPALTRGSCVGCHEGTNTAGSRPFVVDLSGPDYGVDTLAGGNFFWAITDDAKGHNVSGIPGMTADATLLEAPGGRNNCANSCHETLFEPEDSGSTLTTGCQGCHLNPKHHAPQQVQTATAVEENGWFRFLSGHMSGDGAGVEGIEDIDWQLTATATDHNEYLGNENGLAARAGFYNQGNTMTAYCCGCHGDFHIQRDGSGANASWIRHPSDAVIPDTAGSEYAAINVAFNPSVPVARNAATLANGPSSDVTAGEDMVMCLSCHRAHGSPYDDMLRWDYGTMVAGNGVSDTGCFVCHTAKD